MLTTKLLVIFRYIDKKEKKIYYVHMHTIKNVDYVPTL
jgi:hypothetical protein